MNLDETFSRDDLERALADAMRGEYSSDTGAPDDVDDLLRDIATSTDDPAEQQRLAEEARALVAG